MKLLNALALITLSIFPAVVVAMSPNEVELLQPIDAFSVRLHTSTTFQYQTTQGGAWGIWKTYEDDGDSVAGGESELVMVPPSTTGLRVRGIATAQDIHPILVSTAPPRVRIASTSVLKSYRIISREEWGADASLLYGTSAASEQANDTGKGDSTGTVPLTQSDQRVQDCNQAQSTFPLEFQVQKTVTKDAKGRAYLWPLQYSSSIKLFVIHHSAIQVTGDPRSGVERLRALYKYHAQNRGWGDIGYNYIIDDQGQIYEGRQGGPRVVGGHAYCNNIGTIGILLMGNFEVEKPTSAQAKSLQHLLADVAEQEGVDLGRSVQFHGKSYTSPIIGHRDVLSTACPGYTFYSSISQIRSNLLTKRVDGDVLFPDPKKAGASTSTPRVTQVDTGQFPVVSEGISFVGRTAISINPGGKQRLSFAYTAGAGGAYEGKKIADIKLSSPGIKLYIDDGVDQVQVRTGILLPYDLPEGDRLTFQLIIEAPLAAGNYTFSIGGLPFTMSVSGRRAHLGAVETLYYTKPGLTVTPKAAPRQYTPLKARVRPQSRSLSRITSSASSVPSVPSTSSVPSPTSSLRLRLSVDPNVTVSFASQGLLGDERVNPATTYSFISKNDTCVALSRGEEVTRDLVLRLSSTAPLTVSTVRGMTRQYRGVLECRVIDGALVMINELPIEEYMLGLAEEPDIEPYEKQRAFAIAARTYATYYKDPTHRKFPGKPYDGSDDPATFQAYHGVDFESRNPEWVRAVKNTSKQVLLYKNAVLRVPYFSSDDGRTRSPEEAGWKSFPNAEVFSSKSDPWCNGLTLRGHGVGMSGCGALGQAKEGRSAEQILLYYYPGVRIGEIPEEK